MVWVFIYLFPFRLRTSHAPLSHWAAMHCYHVICWNRHCRRGLDAVDRMAHSATDAAIDYSPMRGEGGSGDGSNQGKFVSWLLPVSATRASFFAWTSFLNPFYSDETT